MFDLEFYVWHIVSKKRGTTMSEFDLLISEQLENPGFRKEWNDIQPEMDIIRAMIHLRISQNQIQEDL